RGAAACDPPPRAQFFRELVQARLDVLRRAAQALALDLVPRPVNGLGRQLDTRPGDREPDGLDGDRRWRHTLAPSLDDGCAAAQEEGHVRTHLCGDRLEVEVGVEVGAVQRLQRAQRRGRIRARATHARARWYALVEMKPRRQLSIHGALERLLGLQHGVVIVAELEPRNSQLGGVGSGDDQQVVQLNRLHGRSQLVVAVVPPLDDFEVEVELRPRRQRDGQSDSSFSAQWMTTLSCTLAPAPTLISDSSARSTAPNQTLAPASISTSPTSTAVGATYASGCTRGRLPPSSNSTGPYNAEFVIASS